MNIILEDKINFYKEIYNLNDDNDEDKNNICLLSTMPLDNNKITLPCNHSFNFIPLYKEVCNQKISNKFNVRKLGSTEIKCPYCRQISDKLLPHVLLNDEMTYIKGVNTPMETCMDFKHCNYMFKSGKNKGNMCYKTGFYTSTGCYCTNHHTQISNTQKSKQSKCLCKVILKSGKRKGEECGLTVKDTNQYCTRHLSKL
jgi:hypothetical protein